MAAGPKDRWDKFGVLIQPIGGILTAVAVAYVGMKGSSLIDRQQARDTNARLYSELMSRREEAESSLRKDMFVSIISSFLDAKAGSLDDKVLNLELLAYNFHDSLNLKPLFLDIARRVQRARDPGTEELRQRVFRVAKEITARQLFSLEGHGVSFRRSVDLEELAKVGRSGISVEGEPIDIGGRRCNVNLRVTAADVDRESVQVRLEVKAPEGSNQPDTRAQFEVGWFDFPMIDNTRLANGLRCAVTLAAFSSVGADLTTVCFPGEYASLKDRPYYDEVIQKLQDAAHSQGEGEGTARP